MKFRFCLIFVIFIPFAISKLYTADVIDKQLENIYKELVVEESKIEQLMLDSLASIILTCDNLRTHNLTQNKQQQSAITNLWTALENLAFLLADFSTLDNYWPYKSLKNCSDVNRKSIEIELNLRQYNYLTSKVRANITKLLDQHGLVSYHYIIANATLTTRYQSQSELHQQIATILNTDNGLISEYYNYLGILSSAMSDETMISTNLILYKRQYCICGSKISESASLYFSDLNYYSDYFEKPLIKFQTSILTLAKNALVKAKAAAKIIIGPKAPQLYAHIDRTKAFLTGLITANDFHNITWNNVTVCNDLPAQIGYVRFKSYQYVQIFSASITNKTWATTCRAYLNDSAAVYKLNNNQTIAVENLINAMMKLEPLMQNYSSQIYNTMVREEKVYKELINLADLTCGCNATTTKALTTTKTTKTPSAASINTASCWLVYNLFHTNGNYISSICWNEGGNQEKSVNLCKKMDMSLFTITSETERDALFLACGKLFGYGKNSVIWVSGMNGPNYVDSNDQSTALGSFAYPKEKQSGCLAVSSSSNSFEVTNYDCGRSMSNFCKFTNYTLI